MTDTSPVAETDDGSLGARRAAHPSAAGVRETSRRHRGTAHQSAAVHPGAGLYVLSLIFIPGYFSKLSIVSLLILSSLLGLSSLGQTMTIIAGGIDLSIPAVIGLSDIVSRSYTTSTGRCRDSAAIAALAILIGTINAISSVLLHVHSLITSFGMSLVVSGVALELSNGAGPGACRPG